MTGQFIINVIRGKRTSQRMRTWAFSRLGTWSNASHTWTRSRCAIYSVYPHSRFVVYLPIVCARKQHNYEIEILLLWICIKGARAYTCLAVFSATCSSACTWPVGSRFLTFGASAAQVPHPARRCGLANDLSKDLVFWNSIYRILILRRPPSIFIRTGTGRCI